MTSYQGRIETPYNSLKSACLVRPTNMDIMDWMDVMDGNAGLKAQFKQGQAKPFICLDLSCAFSFECPLPMALGDGGPVRRPRLFCGEIGKKKQSHTQPYQGSRPANLLPVFGMEG